MYIIGVYGRSGAGKSTLSKKLAEDLDAVYVDVDKYWKNIFYSNFFQKTFVRFLKKDNKTKKPESVDQNVHIKDLKVSPKQVELARKVIYQYLNYRVNRKIRKMKKSDSNIVIIDHIIFFKFDAFKKSDFIIYVNTSSEVSVKNVMKRDYITEERMNHLLNKNIVEKHDEFDFISNNFEISAFESGFDQKYQQMLKLIKEDIKTKNNEKKDKIANLLKQKNNFDKHNNHINLFERNKN